MGKDMRMRVPVEFVKLVREMMAKDPFKTKKQCLEELARKYGKQTGLR